MGQHQTLVHPDIFSALLGRWHEDQWASVKLTLWIGISVLAAIGAYAAFQ
ncbi:hypothetical protein ACG2K1_05500 [Neisseria sp. 23W00296]